MCDKQGFSARKSVNAGSYGHSARHELVPQSLPTLTREHPVGYSGISFAVVVNIN